MEENKMKKTKKGLAIILVLLMVFGLVSLNASAVAATGAIVENDESFNPYNDSIMNDIPWDKHAHTGFDSAFTAARAHNPADQSHIQLDGTAAYFYGYYTGPYSDYLYYKESDPTEKTFSFSINFSVYPANNSNIPQAQRWHSLRSVGFLVNCVENSDNTISGYYFSFEQRNYQDRIVIRLLNHVSLTALYSNSVPIVSTPILTEIPFGSSLQAYLFEIKSSQKAFSVKKDGSEIFSLDLSKATASQIPSGYTGGNDFGFYAAYIGMEGGHSCNELSFAEFKNIQILTKTVTPQSSVNVHFADYKTRDNVAPTEICDIHNATGYIGQDYKVTPPPTIDDYTYVNANTALTGSYAIAPSDITLFYVNPTLTVRCVDQDGNIIEEVVKTGLSPYITYDAQAKDFTGYRLKDDAEKSIVLTPDHPDGIIEFKYIAIYTVTFVDWNDTVLDKQIIEHGSAAEAPADQYRDRYMFVGWDEDFSEITNVLTVKAMYELIVLVNAKVTSFDKNLQNKNNDNLRFTVALALNSGEIITVNHAEKVNGQQKGNKTFVYNTPYGSYTVYVAWNDNNMVTTCEVKEVKPARDDN